MPITKVTSTYTCARALYAFMGCIATLTFGCTCKTVTTKTCALLARARRKQQSAKLVILMQAEDTLDTSPFRIRSSLAHWNGNLLPPEWWTDATNNINSRLLREYGNAFWKRWLIQQGGFLSGPALQV